MITIHFDFTDGTEVSYAEGFNLLNKGIPFSTHCLDFFSFDYGDVRLVKNDGSYISVQELLKNTGEYTNKQIRKEHNIRKVLGRGEGFKWKC